MAGIEMLESRRYLAAGHWGLAALAKAASRPDTEPPQIIGVVAPLGRPVAAGQPLTLTVRFNEPVRLTASAGNPAPTLPLAIDGYVLEAGYVRGSGSRALTFSLDVPAGLGGRIDAAGAIAVPSGSTLTDLAGNPASLTPPSTAQRTLGRVVVDGVAPAVLAVGRPVARAGGQTSSIVVHMSEAVVVRGRPTVRTLVDGVETMFAYAAGSGTDRLRFVLQTPRRMSFDGRFLAEPALRLGPGSAIHDRVGNAYGPAPVPVAALQSAANAAFSRRVVASDNVLDVYVQTSAAVIEVGGGGGGENRQIVTTLAMPAPVEQFVRDTLDLLDPLVNLGFRFTTDRSRADLVLWIDTSVTMGDVDGVLGVTLDNWSAERAWWEIALNGPLISASRELMQYAILHEIGHALGNEHPFDDSDGDSAGGTNPATSAYADDTVMAYRGARTARLPSWYTANDIRALQSTWGIEPPRG